MDFRGRLERAQDASVGADGSPTVISRVRIHFQQYGTEWVHCINLGGIAEVSGFCPKRQGQRLFLFLWNKKSRSSSVNQTNRRKQK
jgi:1,6-anhydro-N-acetylmuramate kinase